MGFFASLLGGGALQALVGALAGPLENIFHDYIQGKISKEQLQEQIQAAMLTAFAQVETSYMDSMTKTYATFMQDAVQNPIMIRAWTWVLYSQLGVLVWHQLGIPLFVLAFGPYPSSGVTSDWSYALVAACIGVGPIALSSSLVTRIKGLFGK